MDFPFYFTLFLTPQTQLLCGRGRAPGRGASAQQPPEDGGAREEAEADGGAGGEEEEWQQQQLRS